MIRSLILGGVFALFIYGASPSYAQTNYEEAVRLYQQVITGERKLEDLSPEEQKIVILVHQSRSASDENIDGYTFSLRDIEKKCEVWKWSDSYGDVECRGSALRVVEKKCEAYFSSSQNGELDCRGSDFSVVERKCSISMYSYSYGDIDC